MPPFSLSEKQCLLWFSGFIQPLVLVCLGNEGKNNFLVNRFTDKKSHMETMLRLSQFLELWPWG